jgi:hypothetical protein
MSDPPVANHAVAHRAVAAIIYLCAKAIQQLQKPLVKVVDEVTFVHKCLAEIKENEWFVQRNC